MFKNVWAVVGVLFFRPAVTQQAQPALGSLFAKIHGYCEKVGSKTFEIHVW